MDGLDRHEFQVGDLRFEVERATDQRAVISVATAEGERDVSTEDLMERVGSYVLRLAERVQGLTEERDGWKMDSECGSEIIGELSRELAALAGERLVPCDPKGRCPGHLGPKARSAVRAAADAWRALQEGNEKAAQRIAELEATNEDFFIEKQALGRDKDLLKARIAELETDKAHQLELLLAAEGKLRDLERQVADAKSNSPFFGRTFAEHEALIAEARLGEELVATLHGHSIVGEPYPATLRRIISQWLARGEKLAELEKDHPAGWLNPAQAAIIGSETNRLRIDNANLTSRLLAAETEKARLSGDLKEARRIAEEYRREIRKCGKARRAGADENLRLRLDIEQLKVDVAHWRRMAVRDDPLTENPQAVVAAHRTALGPVLQALLEDRRRIRRDLLVAISGIHVDQTGAYVRGRVLAALDRVLPEQAPLATTGS